MIQPVNLQTILPSAAPVKSEPAGAAQVTKQFGQFLNDAITNLSAQQTEADKLSTQFAKGEITDVSQLMIASEKASVGLELTVQTRNKMIEAYQEIMRMQM